MSSDSCDILDKCSLFFTLMKVRITIPASQLVWDVSRDSDGVVIAHMALKAVMAGPNAYCFPAVNDDTIWNT
jgi:hypothetical protein